MPPNRDAPAVPATRLACDRCHDHKLRCDRSPITGEPCRRCARVKAECRYGRPRRFGRPRKRKDSPAEDLVAGVPAAAPQEPAATTPPSSLTERDSGAADIDSPTFYEVGASFLGKDAMPLMSGTWDHLPPVLVSSPLNSSPSGTEPSTSAEMLLSEGRLYVEPPAPGEATDWLGTNMAATDIDIDMSLFTDFGHDDLMFTEDGRLPTPPDSPDSASDSTTAPSCSSTLQAFPPHITTPSPLSQPLPLFAGGGGTGQGDDIVDALTQLHLRLHHFSMLSEEPLLDQSEGRCTLIEETIKASQTFIEILCLMCQPGPASPPSPMSPATTTPAPHSSMASCCSLEDVCSPTSPTPPPLAGGGPFTISASASLLTLLCYVRIMQSCRDVLSLLRRVLSPAAVAVGDDAAAAAAALDCLGASLLPQITIGSVRPMSSSPRIQVALLAQLLASLLDEVRACIRQLLAVTATPVVVGGGGGGGKSTDARSTGDLMRLAEEGVWREEAELKGQLLAMTQLMA